VGNEQSLQILLVTRGRDPFKGYLALPGGYIEYNESPEEAVLRELKEETGLTGYNVQLIEVRGDP
jgi:8-oxo-dGTP diphosphatase